MHRTSLVLESLESRLALAAVVTYTDIDGDIVTAKTSKGTSADLETALVRSGGANGQLLLVDFVTNPVFAGTTFALSAKKAGGGDGFVAVGEIRADVDLGAVSLQGDLGRISAGDVNVATPGVASLSVASLGRYGTSTGAPSLSSLVIGAVPTFTVKGDVVETQVVIQSGGIGKLSIGGSLIGGADDESGSFNAANGIASVTLKGNLVGGSGNASGRIMSSSGALGTVSVGNAILGGAGAESGTVFAAQQVQSVTIAGNIVGGSGDRSGSILVAAVSKIVSVGGSVIGGRGFTSGGVGAAGRLAAVRVAGDVRGGEGPSSGVIGAEGSLGTVSLRGSLLGGAGDRSGLVLSLGAIGSVTTGGAIVGGSGRNSGSVVAGFSGSPGDIASVTVGQSLIGGGGEASGQITAPVGSIATVTVKGSVVGGSGSGSTGAIVAGQNLGTVAINGNLVGGAGVGSGVVGGVARISTVGIKGSLIGGAGQTSGTVFAIGSIGTADIGRDVIGGQGIGSGGMRSTSGSIAKVSVGGSVLSGTADGSGSIGADQELQSVSIKKDVIGGGVMPLQIFAAGNADSNAIGRITVGGSVRNAVFLAGWEIEEASGLCSPVNGSGTIASISIRGTFDRSSISAGVQNALFPNFGNAADAVIAGPNFSSIGSVVIGSTVAGSGDATRHFGIVSRSIGAVKVNGKAVPIPAAGGFTPVGIAPNVDIHVLA